MDKWMPSEAVELCRQIEAVAPQYGFHVALTGGVLYKDGPRKDLDLLFYRIRQEPDRSDQTLLEVLEREFSIVPVEHFGWLWKAECNGKNVDLFFPELYPAGEVIEGSEYN